MPRAITLETIQAATTPVYRLARRTPLVPLEPLAAPTTPDDRATTPGHQLHLKLETLQPIGAFKIRGAAAAVAALTPRERQGGIWTVSAGNAAQGVALAARHAGIPCTVMVIETAPSTKLEAIERLGAHIVKASYDECWDTVEHVRHDRLPGHFIHPFDDDHFISGNGTIGLEVIDDLPDIGSVVASVGGGGLLTGVATAIKALKPGVRVYAAEPETAAPLAASLARGRACAADHWRASFVDGCGGKSVTPTMWPLLRNLVDESIVVSLEDIANAMRLVAANARVVTEGAAGCAVAAALTGRAQPGPVVAIVSGGNIDRTTFARILTGTAETNQAPAPSAPGGDDAHATETQR